MTSASHENTQPTEEDDVIAQLRRDGLLGPFVVSDWAGDTDLGKVRELNEDRWGAVEDRVFVLADGMGGREAGALAASTAVDEALIRCGELSDASASGIIEAINAVSLDVGRSAGVERMGTTLVVLVAFENHVVVMSVGDSRIYRFRDDHLEALTTDHTVRNELRSAGLSEPEIEASNFRLTALTAHIGMRSEHPIPVDVATYSVHDGDRFLLCSDGVHSHVDRLLIAAAMKAPSCSTAARRLVEFASEAGGKDNATVVVAQLRSTAA